MRWVEEQKWPRKSQSWKASLRYIEDLQPSIFNHVHCRGMAAKAWSVQLIYLKLYRPKGRGQDTPTTVPSHSSRTPITLSLIQHHTKMNNVISTPTTIMQLNSCVGGAAPPQSSITLCTLTTSPHARLCPQFHLVLNLINWLNQLGARPVEGQVTGHAY